MPLTEQLLDRLDAQWQRLKPAWYGELAPGLTDDQMDELTAPLGLTLPPEFRTWWRWHNGTTSGSAYLNDVCQFFTLEVAIEAAQEERDLAAEAATLPGASTPAEEEWPSPFFPVSRWGSDPICTDCLIQEPSSPMFLTDKFRDFDVRELLAPSFGDIVHRWVEMYEAGYYSWVNADFPGGGWWDRLGLAAKPVKINLI